MALTVMLSTISWTVDKHLCMGRVMDVSLFVEAEDCGMADALSNSGQDSMMNHCCDDESFTLSGQEDLTLTWLDFDLDQQVFLFAFSHSYLDLYSPQVEPPAPHEEYPPPLLVKDIHILDQVFLI
ncbi:hypothetical protein EW142_15535 [Flagellimonas allohymeniacidonis]|uniref:Uncharacterized protein n=2 Tax=Flagellimonas allohymeniacidonis TaxID=2517819 RepID=A0A4V2HSL5_9FLAO|nr:hypothetical protein EW142_15535 [Allomuricauda hymeniacidonis]